MEKVQLAANVGVAVFSLIAAALWFLSAAKPLPEMGTYWDRTPSSDPFYVALRASARLNRWAAFFSGLAAVCAVLSVASLRSSSPVWPLPSGRA